MEKLQFQASVRDPKKDKIKTLTKQGIIPAVLYGHGIKTVSLSVNANEFERLLKKAGESTVVELSVDGKVHPVLIHEVQIHYLTSRPRHVDFYQVSMTEKLKAKVSLEYTGEAKAVKELGGVLVKILNEVEVECLPADLPHSLVVDISVLKSFADHILVKNLIISDKVKITTPSDEMVAKIQPPRDVEAELAAPVVEDITKVEGAAEIKPEEAAQGAVGDKAEKSAKGGSASGGKEEKA